MLWKAELLLRYEQKEEFIWFVCDCWPWLVPEADKFTTERVSHK